MIRKVGMALTRWITMPAICMRCDGPGNNTCTDCYGTSIIHYTHPNIKERSEAINEYYKVNKYD